MTTWVTPSDFSLASRSVVANAPQLCLVTRRSLASAPSPGIRSVSSGGQSLPPWPYCVRPAGFPAWLTRTTGRPRWRNAAASSAVWPMTSSAGCAMGLLAMVPCCKSTTTRAVRASSALTVTVLSFLRLLLAGWWLAGADDAGFVGDDDELGPGAGAELEHGPVDVGLGGEGGDEEPCRDVVVGQASGGESHGLAFARGEGVQPTGRVVGRRGGLGEVAGDEALGGGRGEQGFPCGDHADRAKQLSRVGALAEEAAGARAQRLGDVLVVLEGGQDEDLHVGGSRAGGDHSGGGQPVEVGHADVHHDDVGAFGAGQAGRLTAGPGFPHDFHVRLGVDQETEGAAQQRLVVGE